MAIIPTHLKKHIPYYNIIVVLARIMDSSLQATQTRINNKDGSQMVISYPASNIVNNGTSTDAVTLWQRITLWFEGRMSIAIREFYVTPVSIMDIITTIVLQVTHPQVLILLDMKQIPAA